MNEPFRNKASRTVNTQLDDYIVELVKRDIQRRSALEGKLGIKAYSLLPEEIKVMPKIKKKYLEGTMKTVVAHNKRVTGKKIP